MIKVLAANGSPKKEKGNTSMILKPFLEGIEEEGAEVETIYTHSLDLKPCTGEFDCWMKTPGECYIKDDMDDIYPKLREADILVLATPVYIPLPGKFQIFMNRLCPILDPTLEKREGRTRARLRENVNLKKIVLVSTNGWWEKENADIVVRIVREFAEVASVDFSTPILRPHFQVMIRDGELTEDGKEIMKEVMKAGKELISNGDIDNKTADKISHPLVTFDEYMGIRSDEIS